jgi:hypothetical protein
MNANRKNHLMTLYIENAHLALATVERVETTPDPLGVAEFFRHSQWF